MNDPEGGFACPLCGLAHPHRHGASNGKQIRQLHKAAEVTKERGSWKSAYPLIVVNCPECGGCSAFHRCNIREDTDGFAENQRTGNRVMRCPHCRKFMVLHLVGWNPKAGMGVA
jgi:predicted RNA-binding Zn-ribbon protein involved in translation (DUF1610 family)